MCHRDEDGRFIAAHFKERGHGDLLSPEGVEREQAGVSTAESPDEQSPSAPSSTLTSRNPQTESGADSDSGIVVEELDLTEPSRSRVTSSEGHGEGLNFSREALQEYVLMCSQQPEGGLRDKPGK